VWHRQISDRAAVDHGLPQPGEDRCPLGDLGETRQMERDSQVCRGAPANSTGSWLTRLIWECRNSWSIASSGVPSSRIWQVQEE